jgi:shikimate kinase
MRIFLIGFMGCGKTYWGRQLSQKLAVPFFDLDEKIFEQTGKSIPALFNEEGEEAFRRLEKESLHLITESHETFVMATGGGTPCYFNTIDYLKRKGTVAWINCSVDCLHQRLLKEKEQRPLIADVPDSELSAFIARKYANRKIFYQQAHITLSGDELTLETLADSLFPQS